MTGLEKIILKIEKDNEAECESIIAKANEQAKEIVEKAKIESEQVKADILNSALDTCKKEIELANSRAELEQKKKILSIKIDIVNDLITNALKKLKNLPEDEYFNTIKSLISAHVQKGDGILCFSKADLNRIPQNFETEINEMLKDSSVKISSEPVNIDGGFILKYEDIEQNCSFDALLASKSDEIKDELYANLFKRENL